MVVFPLATSLEISKWFGVTLSVVLVVSFPLPYEDVVVEREQTQPDGPRKHSKCG